MQSSCPRYEGSVTDSGYPTIPVRMRVGELGQNGTGSSSEKVYQFGKPIHRIRTSLRRRYSPGMPCHLPVQEPRAPPRQRIRRLQLAGPSLEGRAPSSFRWSMPPFFLLLKTTKQYWREWGEGEGEGGVRVRGEGQGEIRTASWGWLSLKAAAPMGTSESRTKTDSRKCLGTDERE